MNKTVLLLGGSAQQLDSFAAAKRLGYRTVLCDYDPNCPGRELADSFYEVSTLDACGRRGVLRLGCTRSHSRLGVGAFEAANQPL